MSKFMTKLLFILLGVGITVLISIIDLLTKDYFAPPFYLVPVIIVTWFVGRNAGIFISFVSTVFAIVLDIIETPHHTYFLIHYWNGLIILSFFIIVIFFVEKLKNIIVKLESTFVKDKQIKKALREHVKKLNCLYAIADLIEKEDNMEKILQGSADLMPNSWFYPEIACTRIIFKERQYQTGNFRETDWRQSADLKVDGQPVGMVELCYLEKRPIRDEGPFLREERKLINMIAERLGRVAERKKAEETLKEARAFNESTLNSTTDIFYSFDLSGKFLSWNKTFSRISGYSDQELSSKKPIDFFLGEDIQHIAEAIERIYKEGTSKAEANFVLKDGRQIPCEFTSSILRDSKGNIIGFSGTGRDLTERKKADEALRESEYKIRAIFDQAFQFIGMMTPDGTLIEANRTAMQFAGINESDCLGKPFWDTPWWTHSTEMQNKLREAVIKVARGETVRFEATHPAADGSIHYIDFSLKPVKDENGKIIFLIPEGRDITERKKVEEAIVAAKDYTENIIKSMFDTLIVINPDGNISSVNKATTVLLGYKEEELIGKPFGTIVAEEEVPFTDSRLKKVIEEGFIKEYDMTYKTKSGEMIPVSFSGAAMRDKDGELIGIVCIGRDLRERKQAEAERETALKWQQSTNALRQSLLVPAMLEHKLKSITDGIVRIFDADFCRIWLIRPGDLCEKGCIHAEVKEGPHVCHYRDKCLHLVASSGRYTHTNGKDHARVPFGCYKIGRVASGGDHKFMTNDVVSDPRVHNHEWARELGLVSFAGYQLKVPGGETIGVLALFAKHPILSTEDEELDSLSITAAFVAQEAVVDEALKDSQEQLFQQSKMASLGQLSAGAAHEINNPLAAVVGFTEATLLDLKNQKISPERIARDLGIILKNTNRCRVIIGNLLHFARAKELQRQESDINSFLDDALSLVEYRTTAQNIKVVKRYQENPRKVNIDQDQMIQVFINVISNAQSAMPDGGELLVRTWSENNFVGIEFKDTGMGIEKEALPKVFDPFFTTQAPGQGVGLGLSISYSIMRRHEGTIEAKSDGKNKGAAFIIKIPA